MDINNISVTFSKYVFPFNQPGVSSVVLLMLWEKHGTLSLYCWRATERARLNRTLNMSVNLFGFQLLIFTAYLPPLVTVKKALIHNFICSNLLNWTPLLWVMKDGLCYSELIVSWSLIWPCNIVLSGHGDCWCTVYGDDRALGVTVFYYIHIISVNLICCQSHRLESNSCTCLLVQFNF